MTTRPASDPRVERSLRLAVLQAGPPSLERHPNDGWRLADPYPLGVAARRSLRALIDALCPQAPAPRSPDLEDRVELGARRLLAYMHPLVARALAVGLVLLDWLPLLTFRFARSLHRLPRASASMLLAGWAKSRVKALRLLIQGVRSLVLSVYFDQSEVHAAIGYAPAPFISERMRLRAQLLAPVRAAAE
jgi:hypothetical protein